MTKVDDLKAEFEALEMRVSKKSQEVGDVNSKLTLAINMLVDADGEGRTRIIKQRQSFLELRDLLADELRILVDRRDAAKLAIYEFAVSQAEAEWQRNGDLQRQARQRIDAALQELKYFRNSDKRPLIKEKVLTEIDIDLKYVELEVEVTRRKAEGSISARNTDRARSSVDHAKAELEAVKRELGLVGPAG